jgi:hypothetical protein
VSPKAKQKRERERERERAGLSPMDQHQSPALLASISRQGRPPGGHLELSSEARECPQ